MKNRRAFVSTLVGTAALAGAALFAPAASAGSDVAWSLSFGGPGYGINVGQPGYGSGYYGAPYRPYFRPGYRPVVVAPPVYYRRAPVVYRPVVIAPRPVYYAPAPVVYGSRGYGHNPYRHSSGNYTGYQHGYQDRHYPGDRD